MIIALAMLAATVLVAIPRQAASIELGVTWSKTFDPDTIGAGSATTLRFQISNSGGLPVENLAFSDTLPAGVTIATPANTSSTCDGTLAAPDGGGTISLTGGDVGGSTTCVITVDVTASTPGSHVNTSGDLTSDAGNSGTATDTLTVDSDRPGFTKSFSPSSINLGARSTLTFTIDHTAAVEGDDAEFLRFTDVFPAGIEVADPNNAVVTCPDLLGSVPGGTLTAVPGSSVVDYGTSGGFDGIGQVEAGASCTISVDVVGTGVGVLGNSTSELIFDLGEVEATAGKANAVLTVTADDLNLRKEFLDDPVQASGTVELEFTILNRDRSDAATAIAFTDDLDAILGGLAATGLPLVDPCGAGSTLTGTTLLTLTGGTLAAEGSCTFSVTLDVPAVAPTGAYPNTTSAVTGDIGGFPVVGSPANDTLFVQPVPSLTKEFTDDPAAAGGTVTLQFMIENTSDAFAATDITFTDGIDSALTGDPVLADGFCGAGSSMSYFDNFGVTTLLVEGANLPASGSCTFDLVYDVQAGTPSGLRSNTTSEITAVVDGELLTGPPASDDVEIVGAPRLTKEFTDDPIDPGGTVTLEFTLTHGDQAPGIATDISFTDDLDAALSGLAAVGLPLADPCGAGSSLVGTFGDTLLTLAGGRLTPGASCTFQVTLDVPAGAAPGSHPNTTSDVTATVAGLAVAGNPASDDLRVAALRITKEFTDDPVAAGDTVTLQFRIDNVTPATVATAISFDDDLDSDLTGLAAAPGELPLADPCGAGSSLIGTSGDTFLTLTGGSLAAGTSCTFAVTLDVPGGAAPGLYLNVTEDFGGSLGAGFVAFDNAADLLEVAANEPTLTKEFTDDPVLPGDTVTLEFSITNNSPSETATDIAFTDDLDAALSGLEAIGLPAVDVCGLGSALTGTSVLDLTGGTLPPLGTCTFSVTLQVPAGAGAGIYPNTTSSVTATVGAGPETGAPASDDLEVIIVPERFADLSIEKVDDPALVVAGSIVTYTITVDNAGPDDAGDVVVTDVLPPEATLVSTSGCAEDPTGAPACSLGPIAAGGSAQFTLTARVAVGTTGIITNTASVSSNATDPDPSNNSATEDTAVYIVLCDGVMPTIVGTDGNDIIFGTTGDDVILALDGDDLVLGLSGNDLICGGRGADDLRGLSGDDTIFGQGGRDELRGGPGVDSLHGGTAADLLLGGDGDDVLRGESGADELRGESGMDDIRGGRGNDSLFGGKDDDTLLGDPGYDTANGGDGVDTCITEVVGQCELP